jgi:hypothetical protein
MDDINCGWYTVRIDGDGEPCVDLQELADKLPHGSGIDDDWYVTICKNGNLLVSSSFHEMDEWGGYCGWRNFSFRIYRAKTTKRHPLKGPCAGKVQIIHKRGDILMSGVRGTNKPDLNEYLDDMLAQELASLLSKQDYPLEDAASGS